MACEWMMSQFLSRLAKVGVSHSEKRFAHKTNAEGSPPRGYPTPSRVSTPPGDAKGALAKMEHLDLPLLRAVRARILDPGFRADKAYPPPGPPSRTSIAR